MVVCKSIIVATASNNVIGNDNKLLWHITEDLKYFKSVTKGKPVIMGRKTYESIIDFLGKPLPGRLNIVVTRNSSYDAVDGVLIAKSIEEAVELAVKNTDEDEIFCLGGSQIYAAFLNAADRVYRTVVDKAFDGDASFPELDENVWTLSKTDPQKEPHELSYRFEVWDRKP